MSHRHRLTLPVLWMIVIFAVSSIPGSEFPEMSFPGFDKLAHLVEYSILGFLWGRVLNRKIAVVIGILYGILDEIHQLYVPYREFSILDMIVDGVGVIIGSIWHSLLKR